MRAEHAFVTVNALLQVLHDACKRDDGLTAGAAKNEILDIVTDLANKAWMYEDLTK